MVDFWSNHGCLVLHVSIIDMLFLYCVFLSRRHVFLTQRSLFQRHRLGIEEIGHLIEQPFLGDPLDGDEIWGLVDGE